MRFLRYPKTYRTWEWRRGGLRLAAQNWLWPSGNFGAGQRFKFERRWTPPMPMFPHLQLWAISTTYYLRLGFVALSWTRKHPPYLTRY